MIGALEKTSMIVLVAVVVLAALLLLIVLVTGIGIAGAAAWDMACEHYQWGRYRVLRKQ